MSAEVREFDDDAVYAELGEWGAGLSDLPGVYGILCQRTREIYIGQSRRSIEERLREHYGALERGKHRCSLLQKRFDHYGAPQFSVFVFWTGTDPEAMNRQERAACRVCARFATVLNGEARHWLRTPAE